MNETPIPAVLAVVLRGQDALLVRRRNEPDAGLWGYPGGRIEWGETTFEGAERELREETGVIASAREHLTTIDVIRRGDDGRVTHHFVLTAVLCDYLAGEPHAADDALEAAWVTQADITSARISLSEYTARVMQIATRIASATR